MIKSSVFLFLSFFLSKKDTELNILLLKKEKNYHENITAYEAKEVIFIEITVNYNIKNTSDEEFTHKLKLQFPKTTALKEIILDPKSTTTADGKYSRYSVWRWPNSYIEPNISGIVKIISSSKKSMEIEMDLKIIGNDYYFKGKRKIKLK